LRLLVGTFSQIGSEFGSRTILGRCFAILIVFRIARDVNLLTERRILNWSFHHATESQVRAMVFGF
jgi:hypothetical protein